MPCASYEVFETPKANSYKISLQPINISVELSPRRPNDISDGFIEKSPLQLLNNAHLVVFDTDYDNYAGVIECKDTDGLFYMSITFSSRLATLDENTINKMKKTLIGYGVDVTGLKIIRHDICV